MTGSIFNAEQRAAWENIFRHYVFGTEDANCAHIPQAARGLLAPMEDATVRTMRAQLLNKLNR